MPQSITNQHEEDGESRSITLVQYPHFGQVGNGEFEERSHAWSQALIVALNGASLGPDLHVYSNMISSDAEQQDNNGNPRWQTEYNAAALLEYRARTGGAGE